MMRNFFPLKRKLIHKVLSLSFLCILYHRYMWILLCRNFVSVSIGNATYIVEKNESKTKLLLDGETQTKVNSTDGETDTFISNFKSEKKKEKIDTKREEKKNADYSDTAKITRNANKSVTLTTKKTKSQMVEQRQDLMKVLKLHLKRHLNKSYSTQKPDSNESFSYEDLYGPITKETKKQLR